MNIFIVVDKMPSAIYTLAELIQRYNPHHDIKILPVHPKKCDVDTLFEAQKLMKWADIIHVMYWKSGEVIKNAFPKEFEAKKTILTHHNPYDIPLQSWDNYTEVVVVNETQSNLLPKAKLIPLGVDLHFFKYQENYPDNRSVMMSVARIEGKKGIFEVAQACKELGVKLILAGRVSEMAYMKSIDDTLGDLLEFHEDCTNEELLECYYNAGIHVCNSMDNFESGTLPILEAMACGTPVLTRNIGIVPDIFDGKNMVVRKGAKDDLEDLKTNINDLLTNKMLRDKIRDHAWNRVRLMSGEIYARRHSHLYYDVISDKPLVSIIIPTCNRGETLVEVLSAALTQDYPNYEVVIADSSDNPIETAIHKLRHQTKVPLKYVRIERRNGEYTLAKARNEAVIQAEGKILVFCDDRLAMSKEAVKTFADNATSKMWYYGTKDGYEKGFVENFSSLYRQDFIDAGMCNERINKWGGMTQELRIRFEKQGFIFQRAAVDAHALTKTHTKPKEDIIYSKYRLQIMYE